MPISATSYHQENFGGKVTVELPSEPPAPRTNYTYAYFGGKVYVLGEQWTNWSNWWAITYSTLSAPTNFSVKNYTSTSLEITWTKNPLADKTSIVMKKGSYPVDHTDGVEIYNNTGESWYPALLDVGTYYYCKAWSWNNTNGWSTTNATDNGTTNPANPSNFINTSITINSVDVEWTNGTNATRHVIRYSLGTFPANPQSGNNGYNGTSNSTTINGLVSNTTYYLRLWSWKNPFSEDAEEMVVETLNASQPDPPYNGSIRFYGIGANNITWNRGNRSDEDVVVKKDGSYPTTWSDGTLMDRTNNSTGIPPLELYYYNESGISQAYYYCVFSYNITNSSYSVPCEIPLISALGLNCYNESNPSEAIPFDILITNENASQTYQADDLTSTHWIPVESIPYGNDTIFYISSEGYKSRTYYYDVELGTIYNLTFYLPPEYTQGGGGEGGGEEQATLRQFTNAVTVTNPAVNTTIELTYKLEDLITVETYEEVNELLLKTDSASVTNPAVNVTIAYTKTPVEFEGCYKFNSSIYGGWETVPDDMWDDKTTFAEINASVLDANTTTVKISYYYYHVSFGQWISVPNDLFAYNETEVEIDADALTDNTTMARASYYYLHYANMSTATRLYIFHVLNAYDIGIDDARVDIRRYINTTESFEPVTILKTDANGQAETYLIPHVLYKIFITADTYEDEITEWIPDDEFYGIYYPKTFRMNFVGHNTSTSENLFDNITWSIEPTVYYHNETFTIWFNISSSDNKIEWFNATLFYWNETWMSWNITNTSNITTSSGGSINFTVIVNNSTIGKYSLVCMFKKEGFSAFRFGGDDGCRMYYVYYDILTAQISTIPALVYLIITVVITILVTAFLVKFGAGAKSGIGGLAVLGFMFALRPELSFEGVSVWFIFLATAIVYGILMFITRGD